MNPSPVHVKFFHYPFYLDLNRIRLAQLDALPLELSNKSVLDVGCAVGDLTGHFLEKGCQVTGLDARAENLSIFQMRYPSTPTYQINLEAPPADFQEKFDIIFCYSVLDHMNSPEAGIEWLSRRCKELLLIELVVNPQEGSSIHRIPENAQDWVQSFCGTGSRPTREWVFEQLKKHFEHVYIPSFQPEHPQFPMDWDSANPNTLHRAIFIASTKPIESPALLPELPKNHLKFSDLQFLLNTATLPKISLLYSSLRPHLLAEKLEKWLTSANSPQRIETIVVTDAYPPELVETLERFQTEYQWDIKFYLNPKPGNLTTGWNLAASKATGEIFFQLIDEYSPHKQWDIEIRKPFDLNRAQTLAIKDNFTSSSHYLGLAICTRRHYNRYGYLFHPSYQHFGSHNEYSLTAKRNNAIVDSLEVVFNYTPIIDTKTLDTAHSKDASEGYDRFLARKKDDFNRWLFPNLESESTVDNASALTPERKRALTAPHYSECLNNACKAFTALKKQAEHAESRFVTDANTYYPLSVLLLSDSENDDYMTLLRQELMRQGANTLFEVMEPTTPTDSIAQKLEQMFNESKGDYTIVLNDQLWIHPQGMSDLLNAIHRNPSADLVVFDFLMSTDDENLTLMSIDSQHGYDEDDWGFYRPPSHLMCWKKTTIAGIPYTETNQAVDVSWIEQASLRVKEQVRLNKVLYFYNLMNNDAFQENHPALFGKATDGAQP